MRTRILRLLLTALLGGLTLVVPVESADAVLGTGTAWAYYEGSARWENHVTNGYFSVALYPLGHTDDAVLNSYTIRGHVKVPGAWCTGDGDIAYVEADTTGGYTFDATNETYGGPITGTIAWECRNDSASGTAPFKFEFSISPDEGSDPEPCVSPYDEVYQVCDDRRARVGTAHFCWVSGTGCSTTTTIYPGKLFAARVFKAAGGGV